MIIPDVNLLVFASDAGSPFHVKSRSWWEELMSGKQSIGMPWSVTLGFLRIVTNKRIFAQPMSVADALGTINDWFANPQVTPISPGNNHLALLERILKQAKGAAELVPDAHIAAIAMEFDAEVHSHDSDFARFPGIRWHNPLSKP